jgi:hypothetical protein
VAQLPSEPQRAAQLRALTARCVLGADAAAAAPLLGPWPPPPSLAP